MNLNKTLAWEKSNYSSLCSALCIRSEKKLFTVNIFERVIVFFFSPNEGPVSDLFLIRRVFACVKATAWKKGHETAYIIRIREYEFFWASYTDKQFFLNLSMYPNKCKLFSTLILSEK